MLNTFQQSLKQWTNKTTRAKLMALFVLIFFEGRDEEFIRRNEVQEEIPISEHRWQSSTKVLLLFYISTNWYYTQFKPKTGEK